MDKDSALKAIKEEKEKLINWTGGVSETRIYAEELLEIVEITIEGTNDAPIYHPIFERITKSLTHIFGNHRSNIPVFATNCSNFLNNLSPLGFPNVVQALRKDHQIQKELTEKLKSTIETGNKNLTNHEIKAKKQINDHESEMIRITKSHNEQLEFEVPLRTWVKAAEGYNDKGIKFLTILVGLTLFAAAALTLILLFTPEEVLIMFSGENKNAAIRWSITFFVLIGFLTYTIRAVTKAMFSSFHLARDAEERALLTKYYLGLIRKGALEKEDRLIIMQSLFSRSDTGLLKEDGSPTMAGDLVAKMKPR